MLINKSDYLDQYDKELKAEPYGKSKQEKIDALSEMTDEFKLLYGCRADIAIKMVNEQSELLTRVSSSVFQFLVSKTM